MSTKKLGSWSTAGLLAFSAQALVALPAAAQVCSQTAACPTGSWCEYEPSSPSSGGACEGGSCTGDVAAPADCEPGSDCGDTPVPLEGQCVPLPDGICESDGDCAVGLTCVKGTSSSSCRPSDSGEPCDTTIEESRYGYCQAPELPCSTDADCLSGLTCVDSAVSDTPVSGGSDSSCSPDGDCDGGSAEPAAAPTKQASKSCEYVPVSCTDNSECGSGYECITVATSESCTTEDVACPEDGECPDIPEQQPPDCTSQEIKACLPVEHACNTDFDCPSDSVCFTFEDAEDTAPEGWGVTGTYRNCLPEGIALLAAEGEFAGPGKGQPSGDGTGVDLDEGAAGEDDGDEGPLTSGGDGKVCSVRPGVRGSNAGLVLFALFGLVILRRRARR